MSSELCSLSTDQRALSVCRSPSRDASDMDASQQPRGLTHVYTASPTATALPPAPLRPRPAPPCLA